MHKIKLEVNNIEYSQTHSGSYVLTLAESNGIRNLPITIGRMMKKPEWTTVQKAPSTFRFPDGESFIEMQTRMVSALDDIRSQHPGGIVVCVSHADPIKAAVAHAMGTHIDLFQRIVISTCSVSAVSYSSFGPVVLTVNSTGGSLGDLRPS